MAAQPTRAPSFGCSTDADDTTNDKLAQALSLLKESKTSAMMLNQGQLPRLPIPDLKDSIADFLRACEPLLSEQQFKAAQHSAEVFLEGDGPKLHEKLLELDAQPTSASYLEAFWEDAYLLQRTPIPINTNPFFVLEDDPTPARTSQIARATSLVWASLKFYQAVREGSLQPDMQRTTPLCMLQYPRLFGTARIPRAHRDEVVFYPQSKHILVMSRGHQYWMDVLDEEGHLCVTQSQLEGALRAIRGESMAHTPIESLHQSVGVLTTEHREEWAVRREKLRGHSENNATNLEIVDSAIFVLNLDDAVPSSPAETANIALHGTSEVSGLEMTAAGIQIGTCTNRWYDKSLQIIVAQNGAAGINFEHSVIDGHSVLRFASDVFTDTILAFAENIRKGFTATESKGMMLSSGVSAKNLAKNVKNDTSSAAHRPYCAIHWDVDQEMTDAICKAEAKLSDMIPQVLEFAHYGKNFIMSKRMSPDAFVQIAFQIAYYRLYRECVPTYETLMTKKFFHGRTEAGYTVSKESILLCKGFGQGSVEDREALLRRAVDAHVQMVRLGAEGRGIRHLFALKCLAERGVLGREAELSSIFTGEGWAVLGAIKMSTSNCGNPALRMFGFGPVHPEGLGIGYVIKDDNMQFCATSRHRQTARFLNTLNITFQEMHDILHEERKIHTKRNSANAVHSPLQRQVSFSKSPLVALVQR